MLWRPQRGFASTFGGTVTCFEKDRSTSSLSKKIARIREKDGWEVEISGNVSHESRGTPADR